MQFEPRKTKSSLAESISKLASKNSDQLIPSDKPLSWWLLIMPGKILLWLEYMFPSTISGGIASARRKDVPAIQIYRSIGFYLAVLFFSFLAMLALFGGK